MDVTVSGKHIEVTDAIRQYATDKTMKLPRYYDRVKSVEVIADKGDRHSYEIELVVHVDRHEHFVARSRGDDLYACIDESIDKLERQLTDFKERRQGRRRSPPR